MTYAIFEAAGFQYRAELGDVLRLPSLDAEAGSTVTFDRVLLGASDKEVLIGRPQLAGASVRAQVLRHARADKIVVFKFKRRKNYRRKTGHRQNFTEVRVNEIDLGGERRASLAAETPKRAKAKKTPKAKAAAAEAKPAAKPKKKTAAKAPAAKATSKPAAVAKSGTKKKSAGSKAKGASKSKKKP